MERSVPLVVPSTAGADVADTAVLAVPLDAALPWLLDVSLADAPSWRRPGDSLRTWAAAARIAVRLVVGRRTVPTLRMDGAGSVHGVWRVLADGDPESSTALRQLADVAPPAAHAVPIGTAAVWDPAELLHAFCDAVADLAARLGGDPPRPGRPRERLLPWTARWAEALRDPDDPTVPLRDDAAEIVAGIATWGASAGADTEAGTVELSLEAPTTQDGSWLLTFGVRTGAGAFVDAAAIWGDDELPAGDEPTADVLRESLLRGLARCARVFPPLDAVLRESAPTRVVLDLPDAWTLIHDVGPLLDGTGMVLALPDDLAVEGLQLRVRLDDPEAVDADDADEADVGPPSQDLALQLAAEDEAGGPLADLLDDPGVLTSFHWELAIGGEALDEPALAALLEARAPLVRWRDRWVRIDPEAAARLSAFTGGGTLPLAEALSFALAGGADVGEIAPEMVAQLTSGMTPGRAANQTVEVIAEGRVGALLDRIMEAADRPEVPATPDGFVGVLRPYQRRGVAWLAGMAELGLGAVLADDMGLGKSVELIGHLLGRRGGPDADPGTTRPWLIVCPTSVVGNWEREIARFAPGLPVTRFHGPDRPQHLRGTTGAVLTSYGVLRRDLDPLIEIEWDVVALDEAQHVKNPTTAGARAVRRLRARQRVALTGTPLENRLAELWSLLDATNPGLLGSRARFGRRFVTPIEKRSDPHAAQRLRRLVAPFVLRREKSDPTVIADLPEKIERTVVCGLTPEQAELYERAVERVLGPDRPGGVAASAMERRGRILALLTELKQICNHPVQHQTARGEPGDRRLVGRSGKLAVAREIVGAAAEAGDQVLVFTQYVEMGRLLVEQLGHDLGVDVPFLHGGVAAGGRDRMVARFQGEDPEADAAPVLVVSLRAGGTGLNLTAATHVVHYDRWWNPAVEDQATDRAHRIGQQRTVEVHKLVTAGTVEERVAEMLERKRALAEAVVGAGESWITELGDDELRDLVALSREAVEDLDDDELDEPVMVGAQR